MNKDWNAHNKMGIEVWQKKKGKWSIDERVLVTRSTMKLLEKQNIEFKIKLKYINNLSK